MKKAYILLILISCFTITSYNVNGQSVDFNNYRWTIIDAKGEVTGRHESSFIKYKDKFYLLGGRGINPVDVFDPKTNTWKEKSKSPMEIHHFQAVVYGNAIYMVGAMTGKYPKEVPLENIWIYYPEKDKWVKGDPVPVAIRRGGAGAVVYKDKIYLACGIDFGHTSGTNNEFNSYDLKTGQWKTLTKAPHIRDHFPAIVVNDKLYLIGGRNTSMHYPDNFGAFFNATMPYVDYYDFKEEKWYTMKETLPVPTAAGGILNVGNKILYIGGEGSQAQAYNNTQCLDLTRGKWSQLSPLNIGRHGSGAIWYNNNVYIAAGSPQQGGGNMKSIEFFSAENNWQSLFNGRNLDGWQIVCTPKDKQYTFWTVSDSTISCNSMGTPKHEYNWLQSEKEFNNFELRFRFQVFRNNKGNSGMQVRSKWDEDAMVDNNGSTKGWMDGPQVDIEPRKPWRDGMIYDETREVRHWLNPLLPGSKIEKDDVNLPKKVILYYADEEQGWNDVRIICNGTLIQTFINNMEVSDYDGSGVLNDAIHQKHNIGMKGHLAFQLHKNNENNIRFKEIEIRELVNK